MKKITILKKISGILFGVLIFSQTMLPVIAMGQTTVDSVVGGVQQATITIPPTPAPGPNAGSRIGTGIQQGVQEGLRDAAGNIRDQAGQVNVVQGGGAGGACLNSVISGVAISGTIAALTATLGVIGVPDFAPDQGLAGAFQSGKSFLDFLEVNCLNPAARAIYSKMLYKMNDSILKWGTTANRGGLLAGSTFVNDVGEYFNAVADESVGGFVARLDDNNQFAPEIRRAVIRERRTQTNNYTPNLAEVILASACNTYNRDQETARRAATVKRNQNNSSFLDLNNLRGIIPGGSNIPFNSAGYRGVYQNVFGVRTSFAQTRNLDSIINSPDIQEAARREAGGNAEAVTDPNPCNRRADTAAEKNAIIDDYNAGRLVARGSDVMTILEASVQPNNIPFFAVRRALDAKDQEAARAVENERTNLANNDGNTGTQRCVANAPTDRTDTLPGEKGPCIKREVVVTGALVSDQVKTSARTSTELLQKLSATATWKDLAKSIVTNLITGFTSQLLNSANGLISFNGKSGGSNNNGSFTRALQASDQGGAQSVAELRTATASTNSYVDVVREDAQALEILVSKVEKVKSTCTELLNLYSAQGSGRTELLGGASGTQAVQGHECNVDPYKQNYKDDPTAGARLANNPIYVELGNLDALKQQATQVNQVYLNAKSTLTSLNSATNNYSASTDVDREITLSTQTAMLLGQTPQETDITQKRSQLSDAESRISRIDIILNRLTSELASLKTGSQVVQQ